jgi:phosphoglycolate phosphatase-like HAD superfamily hydrolase
MRHIIWDWNGTLFDDLHIVVDAVNVSLGELGVEPIDADAYRTHYRRPVHLFYEAILGRPVPPDEMIAIDTSFHDAYHASLDRAGLAPDARAAVGAVVRAGGTQSVLSMWWHDRLVMAVQAFGLAEHMIAVDGHRGGPGETKEQHLRHHVDQLGRLYQGLNAGGIIAVGDITDDAMAANSVGIPCVLYDGGSQPRSDLEATGAPVADSLLEAVLLAGLRPSPSDQAE